MNISNDTIERILNFSKERDWEQFHNPKDLAISLSLEASELLELFQWKNNEEAIEKGRERMMDEIADVLTYAIDFCSAMGFNDLNSLLLNKLKKNEEKYPIQLAKGSNKKYNEL